MVSKRVLDILHHLLTVNPKVGADIISNPGEGRFELVRNLIGDAQIKGFAALFELVEQQIFQISNSHISTLISLVKSILDKSSTSPDLGQNEIRSICSLLSYANLSDRTMRQAIEIVGKLGENQ